MRFAVSYPSIPGIDTSRVVTTGSWARTSSMPSRPADAENTEKPACSRTDEISERMSA
jgi:hypothetical protein